MEGKNRVPRLATLDSLQATFSRACASVGLAHSNPLLQPHHLQFFAPLVPLLGMFEDCLLGIC